MMIVALILAGHDDEDDGDLDGLGAPRCPETRPSCVLREWQGGAGGNFDLPVSPFRKSSNILFLMS